MFKVLFKTPGSVSVNGVPYANLDRLELCFSPDDGIGVKINNGEFKFESITRPRPGHTISLAIIGEVSDLVCDCEKVTFSGELMVLAGVKVALV